MKSDTLKHLHWVLLLVAAVVDGADEPTISPAFMTSARVAREKKLSRPEYIDNGLKKLVKDDQSPETPDDRPSTTSSIEWTTKSRNRSLDYLAKNTVPVVGPTEPTRKLAARPRLPPVPTAAGSGALLAAVRALPSTEKALTEPPVPPTGWALAAMKPSKKASTPPRLKPISTFWSTRLFKTTTPTVPSDVTEAMNDSTEPQNVTVDTVTETNKTEVTTVTEATHNATVPPMSKEKLKNVNLLAALNLSFAEPETTSNANDAVQNSSESTPTIITPITIHVINVTVKPEDNTIAPPTLKPVIPSSNKTKVLYEHSTTSMTRATNATQEPANVVTEATESTPESTESVECDESTIVDDSTEVTDTTEAVTPDITHLETTEQPPVQKIETTERNHSEEVDSKTTERSEIATTVKPESITISKELDLLINSVFNSSLSEPKNTTENSTTPQVIINSIEYTTQAPAVVTPSTAISQSSSTTLPAPSSTPVVNPELDLKHTHNDIKIGGNDDPPKANASVEVEPTTVQTPTAIPIPNATIAVAASPKEMSTTVPTTTRSNEIRTEPTSSTAKPNSIVVEPEPNKNESTSIIFKEPEVEDEDTYRYNTTLDTNQEHNNSSEPDYDDDDRELESSTTSVKTIETTTTTSRPTQSTTTEEPVDVPEPDEGFDSSSLFPLNIRLVVIASYKELCLAKDLLKESIVKLFKNSDYGPLQRQQVEILNLGPRECGSKHSPPASVKDEVPVVLHLNDLKGHYDEALTSSLEAALKHRRLEFKYAITRVEKLVNQLDMTRESSLGGTVIAAIIISSIAGVCLLCLTVLLVIMRKRQKGFNYGQRCTPVSLDDYSLDNISVYNSVRRKAMRASKRSYGNPAFDDPTALSNPLNFGGLSIMVSDKSKTEDEFARIPVVTVKPDELPMGAEVKNRYANVIPLPETRVQLKGSCDATDSYINANYVKGVKGAEKFYIACQAPLQSTIADFWQMIWEQQSRVIIMLTDLHENGVEKCADYLPPSEVLDCHRVFGDLQVTLKKREVREKYIISSLQLKNLGTNSWREVTHMWYASWPLRGVPEDPSPMIAFLIEARSYSKPGPPIVVHCSPGTGRTGTVIAIDIAIRDFETNRVVDIAKTVYNVRRDRAGSVQTSQQYYFIYQVLHFYATKLTGGGLDSI